MKNWIKIVCIGLLVTGTAGQLQAQYGYYNEALLFSRTQFGGSARIQALGGAQVALGGDISLAASNPAGLGFYNRNSFTFSPGFDLHTSQSDYLGTSSSNYKNKFVFPQVGLVFNSNRGEALPGDFKGSSFAVSIQRTNDFNSYMQYVGRNSQSSIVNSFIADAGITYPDELGGFTGYAYDHFLIDEADYNTTDPFLFPLNGGNTYITPNIEDGTIEGYESVVGNYYSSTPKQTESIRTSGGQYVMNGSWGANYNDVFYFGAGLGLHFLDYNRTRSYRESDYQFSDGTEDNLLSSISITDRLSIEGSGVDATIGATLRPLPFLTIGASYHTPTFYVLNENSDFTFSSDWGSNVYYVADINNDAQTDTTQLGYSSDESDIFLSDYTLRTPSRLNVGAALFAGKRGFITGEVEMIDFSTAQLQSNDFEMFADNDAIADSYKKVVNYKLGAELRFDEVRLRGGYNYLANPYKGNDSFDASITSYSGGIGYRNKGYFIDFVAIYKNYDQAYNPYYLPEDYAGGSPLVETKFETISSMVTVGLTF